jgi:2-beta-glucuronyltransferase
MFFDTIKRINPTCKVIYVSSDTLDVIGTSEYCVRALARAIPAFDGIQIPSKAMIDYYPQAQTVYFVPQGIDTEALDTSAPSPYGGGVNIVSVGDMLFDADFFAAAAPARPDVTFHVIGGGQSAAKLLAPNIKVYPEMAFASTLPYVRYADAGLAPYKADKTPAYLADTSMKLMQYRYFGLPAICPEKIAGEGRHRFGYTTSENSIAAAVGRALDAGRTSGRRFLNWAEVTQRILYPADFADTKPA